MKQEQNDIRNPNFKAHNENSIFLNNAENNASKTKSNAIEIPSISLPKGGGAIKGIDEKFSVNAVNGTASFSIPLPFSPARGTSPSLSLSYNSGAGNGIFGLGWNLSLSSIRRKTDKELPQYFDLLETDTFLFSEVEDLVPEYEKDEEGKFLLDKTDYIIYERPSLDKSYTIRFYKPRIEGLFARIERWNHNQSGEIKWRVITKDNVTTLFGWSADSRICNPKDTNKIFEWLPEFIFDDKGNCAYYRYKKEDDKGFDSQFLHSNNRFIAGEINYTNLYLEKVWYGNQTPYKNLGDVFPEETDFLFSTVFDYGEFDLNQPYNKIKDWDFRTDAFSDYKAGFEIRTTRLCKRVLLFHHFNGPNEYEGLVRSLNFEYDVTSQQDFTFLKSITTFGYIKQSDGSYTSKTLPSLEFEYQKHDWNKDVKVISAEDLIHVPAGLDEQQYQFTDLFNEGLAGILTEQATGWFYKHNLGDGKFEQAKLVTPKPSFVGLGSHFQLIDLDADGGKQLVCYSTEPKGYFELNDDNEWQEFRNFQTLPNINFEDANTRILDLNGDGRPEALISGENVFTWYPSEGRNGFSQANKTTKPFDEDAGPHILFSDDTQSIFLSDMSGDGLTDIVRIRNSEVCYWPNLGYGKFGAKVAMDNAPLFDSIESFNPAYIRLADIDGSGTTDIIYLGKNKFTCWMNLSGNTFSTVPFEIEAFPEINSQSRITVTDLLGNGVACIVWSSSLPKDTHASIKYIDLMNSRKPHIMVLYKNNMGKEVSFEYTPSTKFYLDDKLAGKPWITKLHFPVHCVSKTEIQDKISGYHFVSTYKYHHGYYDHPEREFRGFGMVEQTDAENFEHWVKGTASNIVDAELHQEPVVSKTWFHTGAVISREKILSQYAHEYWYEEMTRQGFPVIHHEITLPDARIIAAHGLDPSLVDHLSSEEWCEAFRACKGMGLRSETFATDALKYGNTEDARKKELTPYNVATHNCVIELLQPKGKNKHAIFIVKENEAITYSYERDIEDPRIAHKLNTKVDEYGNVLEAASVVYPRKTINTSLPDVTQNAQAETIIIYTENTFTNHIDDRLDPNKEDAYRLPLPAETKTYQLKGVKKIAETNPYYSLSDFDDILNNSEEALYYQMDKEPDNSVPPEAYKPLKRLIEHVRTIYRKNGELSAALPLYQIESLALPFESYQLAYIPGLLENIFGSMNVPGSKINDSMMSDDGKFTHTEGDTNWWIRSGTTQIIAGTETSIDAQNRFYVPISYTDPYGSETKVKYYSTYFLLIEGTEDAIGNKTSVDKFNFRLLSPQRMKDMNGNLSEVITDELGLVKALAVMGKGNEADDLTGLNEFTDATETAQIIDFFNAPDSVQLTGIGKNLLQQATARFVYDYNVYINTGKPAVVASIGREEHFRKNNNSPVQLSFEYSNGLGTVIMKKTQAEPGLARQVTVNPDDTITISEVDTSATIPNQLRWIGSGRTILNNKGNAVKQYEPYFSVTQHFEDSKELVETGVTPIMYYDAMSRLIKTEMPDGTFSKMEFDSWSQIIYDANDTVEDSEWYTKRKALPVNDPERIAAEKSELHYNTPAQLHFDTLGRPVLQIENNGKDINGNDIYYQTKIDLDVEGNLRNVIDAREIPENSNKGNTVVQYKYDMLGNKVYQNSMDAGQRWVFINVLGNPIRTWDERNHEYQYYYDTLHRLIHNIILGGDGPLPLNHIFDRIIYGESLLLPNRSNETTLQTKNILGRPIQYYDTGGLTDTPEYDFKGQPTSTTRQLFKNYKEVANWTDANLMTDLEPDAFKFTTETDALGRITRQITPDTSIITPSYNEAGLLNSESVLNPGDSSTTTYIKDIKYNEKGQRNKIIYGNNVTTNYEYDKETFRLTSLLSVHSSSGVSDKILQDLNYTYDPVGNIIFIKDDAYDPEFFSNQIAEPLNTYTYNAIYQLIEATGKENNGALNFDATDNWDDAPFMQVNPMAVKKYAQSYKYDSVGNIKEMKHVALGNNWTRSYEYQTMNNRILSTSVGDIANPQNYTKYVHHPLHGFLTELPHLTRIAWNFKEEVVSTIKQRVTNGGSPETTFYQYDGQGQRIRKITENSAGAGANPTQKEERIYIAGFELYKKYSGTNAGLQRISLSLMDGGNRFVMIETRNGIDDGTDVRLERYQMHNHLGSASLELNGVADIINYEEFHPYGTTAYQARNKNIQCAAKRYRYTGMERDEETGLEYHSARYYMPWLGRWTNCDPIGTGDGMNVYAYCNNNTVCFHDKNGHQANTDALDQAKILFKSYSDRSIENAVKRVVGTILAIPEYFKELKEKGPTMVWTREQIEEGTNKWLSSIKQPWQDLNQAIKTNDPSLAGRALSDIEWQGSDIAGFIEGFEKPISTIEEGIPVGKPVSRSGTGTHPAFNAREAELNQKWNSSGRVVVGDPAVRKLGTSAGSSVNVIEFTSRREAILDMMHWIKDEKGLPNLAEFEAELLKHQDALNEIIKNEGMSGLKDRIRSFMDDEGRKTINQVSRDAKNSLGKAGKNKIWSHYPDAVLGAEPLAIGGVADSRINSIIGAGSKAIRDELLSLPDNTKKVYIRFILTKQK
jgi:RHS repeat-associated protein